MLYRRKLDLDIEEIRPELNILRNACAELRGSAKFKHVLSAVLAIGNALNGSTFRGGARGFALEGLGKLKETKTVKGGADCPTLLHYLAKVLLRSDPGLVNFIDEMPHLEPAARVSVQTIMQSDDPLSDRAHTIATFALAGFANLGSLGIQIGVLGALAPSRAKVIARVAMSAMLCGFVSTLQTAGIA